MRPASVQPAESARRVKRASLRSGFVCSRRPDFSPPRARLAGSGGAVDPQGVAPRHAHGFAAARGSGAPLRGPLRLSLSAPGLFLQARGWLRKSGQAGRPGAPFGRAPGLLKKGARVHQKSGAKIRPGRKTTRADLLGRKRKGPPSTPERKPLIRFMCADLIRRGIGSLGPLGRLRLSPQFCQPCPLRLTLEVEGAGSAARSARPGLLRLGGLGRRGHSGAKGASCAPDLGRIERPH